MAYNYTYQSLNHQQILVEISAYEGSGRFNLTIVLKEEDHNIILPIYGIMVGLVVGILVLNPLRQRTVTRWIKKN